MLEASSIIQHYLQQGREEGFAQGLAQGIQQSIEQGFQKSIEQGGLGIEQVRAGLIEGITRGVRKGVAHGVQQGTRASIIEGILENLEFRFDNPRRQLIAFDLTQIQDLDRLKQLRRESLQTPSIEAFEETIASSNGKRQ